jgi:holo-[acyl-carrier protein] synthase
MVLGLGCDIVEIERVAGIFTTERKLARIFTDSEIELARTDSTLAGRFAAKEALGEGKSGVQLKEIEVLKDISGKPYINGERLKQVLDRVFGRPVRISVTISHNRKDAMSVVIIEGD